MSEARCKKSRTDITLKTELFRAIDSKSDTCPDSQ